MMVGYARVSTNDQETRLQLDALAAAGVSTVFQETASGIGARPELQRALAAMCVGDTLVVFKVDRLARSLKDLLALLERLRLAGCSLRSLTEPVDTSSAMGELVLQILGAVAQFERSIIRERCAAGREAARIRGVVFGRQRMFTSADDRVAYELYARGGLSYRQVAEVYGISFTAARAAVLRVMTVRR